MREKPQPPQPDLVVWQDPPVSKPSRAEQVRQTLIARPGQWALIYRAETPFELLPWWGALSNDDRFEVKIVAGPGASLFAGPRDIYARYLGHG